MALKSTKMAGAALALMMLLGAFVLPTNASAASTDMSAQLTTEDGPTDLLGGGDHFFVRFGTDAAFGIVWGTEENPNNIYFVSTVARHLGMVQFYGNQGELVKGDHSLKVYTMYAVKLDNLLEFEDLNGNGILAYMRSYNEQENAFTNYSSVEPIYKMVSLNASWSASQMTYTEDEDGKHWDFSLTAVDLPYELLDDDADADVGDNLLNEVTLSFHLDANVTHVDDVALPQWRVTVNHGPMGATSFGGVRAMEQKHVSGDMPRYEVKWDKEISGWDFDPNNARSALLMEFETMIGNHIPSDLVSVLAQNQYRIMLMATNQLGYAEMQSTTGQIRLNQSTGGLQNAVQLSSPRLSFGGEWSRIGRMEWMTDITVDGVQEQARAQVMASFPYAAVGPNGWLFSGFASLCGISYGGGQVIFHDPTYAAEALVNISSVDDGQTPFPIWLLMIAGAVVGAALIAALILAKRRPASPSSKDSYERPGAGEKGDWSEYYEKK